jgi:hypothetical protein
MRWSLREMVGSHMINCRRRMTFVGADCRLTRDTSLEQEMKKK